MIIWKNRVPIVYLLKYDYINIMLQSKHIDYFQISEFDVW